RPFDLAVLDMHMPGMDGEELGAAIKADPELAAIPLLLLGSIAHQPPLAAPFAGWAAKPVWRAPLLQAIAGALEAGPASPPGALAPGLLKPQVRPRVLHVLVAEDTRANQLVAKGLLEGLGHTVRLVGDGAEALAAWERAGFDLILMDVQMP